MGALIIGSDVSPTPVMCGLTKSTTTGAASFREHADSGALMVDPCPALCTLMLGLLWWTVPLWRAVTVVAQTTLQALLVISAQLD